MYFYLTVDLFDAIELPPYKFLFCRYSNENTIVYAHVHSHINIYVFIFRKFIFLSGINISTNNTYLL